MANIYSIWEGLDVHRNDHTVTASMWGDTDRALVTLGGWFFFPGSWVTIKKNITIINCLLPSKEVFVFIRESAASVLCLFCELIQIIYNQQMSGDNHRSPIVCILTVISGGGQGDQATDKIAYRITTL